MRDGGDYLALAWENFIPSIHFIYEDNVLDSLLFHSELNSGKHSLLLASMSHIQLNGLQFLCGTEERSGTGKCDE